MQIIDLTPLHAADAARLHIAGQPNTFLTSLGPAVLTTFYRALPQSPTAFGFTALYDSPFPTVGPPLPLPPHSPPPHPPLVLGFVSATTSTGQLFLQLGTRHLRAFLPPLVRRFAQRPGLLLHCVQTVFYPLLHSAPRDTEPAAELLSIMVEPAWRSQQIGAHLLEHLVASCRARSLAALDVTVAADNPGARRFYARHDFVEQHRFQLYGRTMCSYRLVIREA
jgi:ribosomal protein S18 acetylase RimI-like enzyme